MAKMEELLDVLKLKALSKESRIKIAGHIRRDQDLWNAVNGLGGLSESALFGRLQGTIKKDGVAQMNALVVIKPIEGGEELKVASDQNGYYMQDLSRGMYSVRVMIDGIATKEGDIEIEIRDGYTASHNVNHVSPIDDGTKLMNEEVVTEPTTDPITEPITEPSTDPTTEPSTDPVDPTTTDPIV